MLFEKKFSGADVTAAAPNVEYHVSVGDLFRSILNTAWKGIKSFVIKVVDGIHQVVVQFENTIYKAVLDCVAAVTHAVEWVFNQVKVFIEDVKKRLGFIFSWKDIVRTHKVIKNVVTTYAKHSIARIDDLKTGLASTFHDLENKLNACAGLPMQTQTMGQLSDSTKSDNKSVDDPQTHYIHDKAEDHLGEAHPLSKAVDAKPSEQKGLLAKFIDFAGKEKDAIVNVIEEVKTQIIESFSTLTLTDSIKRIAAIVGKLALETAKNVVDVTLDLVKEISTAVIDALNEPINIPILSNLYHNIADEELSILDLICLAAAVPSTILFKVC